LQRAVPLRLGSPGVQPRHRDQDRDEQEAGDRKRERSRSERRMQAFGPFAPHNIGHQEHGKSAEGDATPGDRGGEIRGKQGLGID